MREKTGMFALGRETGDVAMEVVEVQELDADGAIQRQEAGRDLHAGCWNDLRDRSDRRIAGEEIERSIRRAVGIGSGGEQMKCAGRQFATGSVRDSMPRFSGHRPERKRVAPVR